MMENKKTNEDGEVLFQNKNDQKYIKQLNQSRQQSQERVRSKKDNKRKKNKHKSKSRKKSRSRTPTKSTKTISKINKQSKQVNAKDQAFIDEENKKIDQLILEEDEEALYERKKRERLNFLSQFKDERIPQYQMEKDYDSDSSLDKQNHLNDHILQLQKKNSQLPVDESKQNYLKMLEALRDQETTGVDIKVQESQVQPQEKVNSSKNKDILDMFGSSNDESDEMQGTQRQKGNTSPQVGLGVSLEADDDDKYYRANVGEILNREYLITHAKSGRGVFSNVVKATKTSTGEEVAIKILRSEELYLRSGEREKSILDTLNSNDKQNKKHIVRLLDHFEHKKHLCLVFEAMEMNLREFIRNQGKGHGLSLDIVRIQAQQLFTALSHLRKHKIIHADIKPDNMLVNKDGKLLKICDFGTAFPVEESSLVEYLVSRFYRAPEIIIGYPYETQIDVWSAACTLFEAYTGKFLFSGSNNNQMIKQHIQTMGKFSQKVLKRAAFVSKYFDQTFTFLSQEFDQTTHQEYIKPLLLGERATRDVLYMLKREKENGFKIEEQKQIFQFKDLLEKCLQLDPKNRFTPDEALLHPFFNQQTASTQNIMNVNKFY